MKRLLIVFLALVLLLAACSNPAIQTSPSLNGQETFDPDSDSGLSHAASYADLIKIYLKAQENSHYNFRTYATVGDAMMEDAAGAPTAAGSKNDYSNTNIQIEGVDEADIIKTDGSFLYLIANNRLYIVDVRDPANLQVVSTTTFNMNEQSGEISRGESPMQMFLDVDSQRLILIVSGYISEQVPVEIPAEPTVAETAETKADAGSDRMPGYYYYYNYKQYTTTYVFDLSDKAKPDVARQFTQTGYYLDSRKIGSAVYVITNEYANIYRGFYAGAESAGSDVKPEDIFPQTSAKIGSINLDDLDTIPAGQISILPEGDVNNQLIIAGIDAMNDSKEPDVLAVLGTSGTVFCSTQFLYVAAYNYPWMMYAADDVVTKSADDTVSPDSAYAEATTDIYRFKLADGSVSEAGMGSVPGSIINQYSMDEYNGFFRIATTTGQMWTPSGENAAKNNVYILNGSMKIVGQLTGLASGETIKSVRFMGNQAYVVTFRNVDPLFVIDLADPTSPKVLGQLKIPGYSTYLHPYADNMLLGFGYDVTTKGDNAYNGGLKVSLFDISDFSNPREVSTILFGGRGSYSELLYSPKALLFSEEKNLIAFPATLYEKTTGVEDYGEPSFQGLLILAVDENKQLVLRGSITHFDKLSDPDGEGASLDDKEWNAFWGYDMITRGAYVGNTLFTISSRQLRSTVLDTLEKLGSVELPDFEEYNGFYYSER